MRRYLISGVLVALLIPYVAMVFSYSVVEFHGLFLYIFAPAIFTMAGIYTVIALVRKHPLLRSLRVGVQLGFVISLILLISNIMIKEKLVGDFKVTDISLGKSGSVNWTINADDRESVIINVRINDVDVNTNPNNVNLTLYQGWLGFYFGN